jgi:hypothetical protein
MVGVLLLAWGVLATVIGWRFVWHVRAVTRRFALRYGGPQVPVWVRRVAPWRLIPGVGEAVAVWRARARLAKLLALPLLLGGPLLTALGAVELAREAAHGFQAQTVSLMAAGAFLAAAALTVRHRRAGRRPVGGRSFDVS